MVGQLSGLVALPSGQLLTPGRGTSGRETRLSGTSALAYLTRIKSMPVDTEGTLRG